MPTVIFSVAIGPSKNVNVTLCGVAMALASQIVAVDVVVVNYKTAADLNDFCHSLLHNEWRTLTIVNNEPEERDRLVAERWAADLGARVINNDENLGYNKAANAAAVGLDSEYLAIFNADVACLPGTIRQMVEFMDEHPEVGIAGPKQLNAAGKITHAGIIGTNTKPRIRGWQERDVSQYDDVLTDIVSVSGSAYFIQRSCWDQLTACERYQNAVVDYTGVPAEGALWPMQHFWGETGCSYHARACGDWKVAYNGHCTMIHHWQRASPKGGPNPRTTAEDRSFFRFLCDAHHIRRD